MKTKVLSTLIFGWRMKSLFNGVLLEVNCVGHNEFELLDFFFYFCLMAACPLSRLRLTTAVYCDVLLVLGILC